MIFDFIVFDDDVSVHFPDHFLHSAAGAQLIGCSKRLQVN